MGGGFTRGTKKDLWHFAYHTSHVSFLFSGLVGFTKSLAKEVASRNVRVNMVAPGFIETDMTSNLQSKDLGIKSLIPLSRFGKVHEVAEAVCSIAEATYMTGQVCSPNL